MTELMGLIYDYTNEFRLNRYLDPHAYHMAEMKKLQHSSSLRETLSSEQIKLLESYLDAVFKQQEQELAAMFQAALEIASELQAF